MCVGCGYDGPEVQDDFGQPILRCPRCAEDLYERPPRSYAELEGLEPGQAPPTRRANIPWLIRQARLFRVWVVIWMAMVRGRGCSRR